MLILKLEVGQIVECLFYRYGGLKSFKCKLLSNEIIKGVAGPAEIRPLISKRNLSITSDLQNSSVSQRQRVENSDELVIVQSQNDDLNEFDLPNVSSNPDTTETSNPDISEVIDVITPKENLESKCYN